LLELEFGIISQLGGDIDQLLSRNIDADFVIFNAYRVDPVTKRCSQRVSQLLFAIRHTSALSCWCV
jgi:hypothetical protein